MNDLGHALAVKQQFDRAIPAYGAALQIAPDFLLAHYNFAEALMAQGHPNLALPHYNRVLAEQPRNAIARFGLARALSNLNRVEDALLEAREALHIQPEPTEIQQLVTRLQHQPP